MLNGYDDASEKQNAKKNDNEQARKNKKSVTLLGIYSLSLLSLGLQTAWFSLQLFYNFPAAILMHPSLVFKFGVGTTPSINTVWG